MTEQTGDRIVGCGPPMPDLQPPAERVEYRVTDVDDARFSHRFPVVPETSYQAACEVLQRCRWANNTSARIQCRTVTETPWEDVVEETPDA